MGTDNCAENATCMNTPGNFSCTCIEGYTGDGTSCEGKHVPFCYTRFGNYHVYVFLTHVRPTVIQIVDKVCMIYKPNVLTKNALVFTFCFSCRY